jgi:hypothetical protein
MCSSLLYLCIDKTSTRCCYYQLNNDHIHLFKHLYNAFKITNMHIYLQELFFFTSSSSFRNTTIFSFYLLMNIFSSSFILCAPEKTFFEQVQCVLISSIIVSHRRRHCSFFPSNKTNKKSCLIVAITKLHRYLFQFFLIIFSFFLCS